MLNLSAASAVDSTGLTQAEVGPPAPSQPAGADVFWQEPCLSRLNMPVPSPAEDVGPHAEQSEDMLSHNEAKGLAQTC